MDLLSGPLHPPEPRSPLSSWLTRPRRTCLRSCSSFCAQWQPSRHSFHVDQTALSLNTPAIAGDPAIGLHDAAVRHGNRNAIRGARRTDLL
jgi:hypothetical protein